MKYRNCLAATAMGLAAASALAEQTNPRRGITDNSPTMIAFQNATLVTEPGKTLENATLIIENGRIRNVGSKVKIPSAARIMDMEGHTIYAGFIDPFSNYGMPEGKAAFASSWPDKPNYEAKDAGGNALNEAIHAQVDWFQQFNPDAETAKSLTQNGFTAVQTARLDGVFRGYSATVSLAQGLSNDLIYKARNKQFASFSKGSSKQDYPMSFMGSSALIRQTLADANWYAEAYGKTDTRYFGEAIEFNAALAALANIEQQGVVFQTESDVFLLQAHRVLNEYKVPAVYVGSGHEYNRLDQIKATRSGLILPLAYPAAPQVHEIDDQLDTRLAHLRHWERAPGNPAAVADAGIPFAFTSYGLKEAKDFWPNLRKAVKHGLSEKAALAALTTRAAEYAGVAHKAGKLAPGMMADLVIVNGDLFDDGHIVSVWQQGQRHIVKDHRLAEIEGDYAFQLEGQALLLKLEKDGDKMKAKIAEAEAKGEEDAKDEAAKNWQRLENTVSFSVATDSFDVPGVTLFKGRFADGKLTGVWQLADGQTRPMSVSRQETPKEDEAEEESEETAVQYISQQTYPNMAYGLQSRPKQENVHIKNATVWTVSGDGKIDNADILIKAGKIERIGKDLRTPGGYEVIDGEGMHVTPGLIDEHSHIAIKSGVNEGSDAVTSEVRIGDAVNPDDIHIYRSLAGGMTSTHLLHGSANPIGGQGQVIKLRWGEDAQGLKFSEAPQSIKLALGENVKQSNWGDAWTVRYPQTRMGVDSIIRDAFVQAKAYQKAWRDYDSLSRSKRKTTAPPRKDYRLEALAEILDKKRMIHTHSYVQSEILALMAAGDDLGFKVDTFTHILEGYKVAQEMAAHGAHASTFSDWWAYKFEVIDSVPQNTCLMNQAGVLVSVNSDDNSMQRRMNQEAAKSVMYCGMSELDAIKMITINPAIQLGIDPWVGSLEKGKHADLVIWNQHPLSVYAQVQQTWIDGRKYYDIAEEPAKQAAIKEEKQKLIQKVLGASDADKKGVDNGFKKQQPTWHCEDFHDIWKLAEHSHGGH